MLRSGRWKRSEKTDTTRERESSGDGGARGYRLMKGTALVVSGRAGEAHGLREHGRQRERERRRDDHKDHGPEGGQGDDRMGSDTDLVSSV